MQYVPDSRSSNQYARQRTPDSLNSPENALEAWSFSQGREGVAQRAQWGVVWYGGRDVKDMTWRSRGRAAVMLFGFPYIQVNALGLPAGLLHVISSPYYNRNSETLHLVF